MNWKLPTQLRWMACNLRRLDAYREADICEAAAKELELSRKIIMHDPVELPIEEGDRANG